MSLANAKNSNKIYHLTNAKRTSLVELLEMYNDTTGALEQVSLYEFIQRLNTYNASNETLAITTFFEKYLEAGEEVLEALQANAVEAKTVQTERTLAYLQELNIDFPVVDKTLVKKYFDKALS